MCESLHGSILNGGTGWLYSSINIVPIQLTANYFDLIELNRKKRKLLHLKEQLESYEKLKLELVKLTDEIKEDFSNITEEIGAGTYTISSDETSNIIAVNKKFR